MRHLLMVVLPVGALLQATLPSPFLLFLPQPDLVLLLVLGWAAHSGIPGGMLWAMVGGVMLDVLSALPFGVHVISLALVVPLVVVPSTVLVVTHPLLLGLVEAFLATWLYHGVILVSLWTLGVSGDWAPLLATKVLPIAILNALLMPLVYSLLGWAGAAPRG